MPPHIKDANCKISKKKSIFANEDARKLRKLSVCRTFVSHLCYYPQAASSLRICLNFGSLTKIYFVKDPHLAAETPRVTFPKGIAVPDTLIPCMNFA